MDPNKQAESVLGLMRGRTLAVAESCTGGAVAARLVSVPGSSGYFLGGVVPYANEVKVAVLGVPSTVLERHGAVSEECALAMARRVRELVGADIGLSTTGVAGPDGGTPEKPVGLVYVALAAGDAEVCTRNVWTGDRLSNIEQSVGEALRLLLEHLETA